MRDIFDIPLILIDDGKYYELKMVDYAIDGLTDFPCQAYITKGKRIYKKDIGKYEG